MLNEQTVRSARLSNRLYNPVWQPVERTAAVRSTIQPVVKPIVKRVWQPVECLYTRYSRLLNRLDNRFDNRLYRVHGALLFLFVHVKQENRPFSHVWSFYKCRYQGMLCNLNNDSRTTDAWSSWCIGSVCWNIADRIICIILSNLIHRHTTGTTCDGSSESEILRRIDIARNFMALLEKHVWKSHIRAVSS